MLNLSKEQLSKLMLHTTAVNSILTEALLGATEPEPADEVTGVDIEVFIIDASKRASEVEPLNLDTLCGDWKGGRKKPDLMIFKAEPGYMAAWGKKPKAGDIGDCYLITEVNGNPCVSMGSGFVYLSYDGDADTLTIHPGGEYTRVTTDKK